jgi:hypothetical protein
MPGLQASTVPPILDDLGLDPWPWPPTMRSSGGRSDAGARGGPAIAPATPFGARRQPAVAATMAWEPPPGGGGLARAPKRPSSPPPIHSRASTTTG